MTRKDIFTNQRLAERNHDLTFYCHFHLLCEKCCSLYKYSLFLSCGFLRQESLEKSILLTFSRVINTPSSRRYGASSVGEALLWGGGDEVGACRSIGAVWKLDQNFSNSSVIGACVVEPVHCSANPNRSTPTAENHTNHGRGNPTSKSAKRADRPDWEHNSGYLTRP